MVNNETINEWTEGQRDSATGALRDRGTDGRREREIRTEGQIKDVQGREEQILLGTEGKMNRRKVYPQLLSAIADAECGVE